MTTEIERKFIINEIPSSIDLNNEKWVFQTYLAIGNEEIRVRKMVQNSLPSYVMTIKKGTGLKREETEFPITESTYIQLLDGSNRIPIIKKRYSIAIDHYFFDVDFFENTMQPNLKTIELEFSSEEEAHSFIPPIWFGKEVTNDASYKNQSLWKDIQMSKEEQSIRSVFGDEFANKMEKSAKKAADILRKKFGDPKNK